MSSDHDHVMHPVAGHDQRGLVDGGTPVEHQQTRIAHHRHHHLLQVAALGRHPVQQVAQGEDADGAAAFRLDDDDGTDPVFRHGLDGLAQAGFRRGGDGLLADQGSQLAVQGEADGTVHDGCGMSPGGAG